MSNGLGDLDIYLIGEGRHEELWKALGSQVRRDALGNLLGTNFSVWAPNARSVALIGSFNYWDKNSHPMQSLGSSGIWQLFVPGVGPDTPYKYSILGLGGNWVDHADPMARATEHPPHTASVVTESRYEFKDATWLEKRAHAKPWEEALSVYEVHVGSWKPGLSYRDLATELVNYVKEMGFTHVEFLPLCEHPYGPSWGYQVTSFFAPTSRFGSPDELRYLIDSLHQADIGVIMDWVPAHFPKDQWALAQFDGTALYEHDDPRQGEHPDWGTLIFNYDRNEVRNFLVASALYWLQEFHIDGIRVDAVASMLYLDYSRNEGEWIPNEHGGRENLSAVRFLQELTATCYREVPGCMIIAEESTAWPGVTRSTDSGGLGFGFKWNMGWMHDTLEYIQEDPINRVYHHNEITKAILYAWSENYMLPFSHDEVVHGKGSLVAKMPGDRWQQLANLRALYGFMWAHPGKKLLFMGCEFAQSGEWNASQSLDWHLTQYAEHHQIQATVAELNSTYKSRAELWQRDITPSGFQWLVVDDGAANIVAFARYGHDGRPLVSVTNFSPVPQLFYKLPLPGDYRWKLTLNTDDLRFGGSGVAPADIQTVHEEYKGQPTHTVLAIPPLATIWLTPEG